MCYQRHLILAWQSVLSLFSSGELFDSLPLLFAASTPSPFSFLRQTPRFAVRPSFLKLSLLHLIFLRGTTCTRGIPSREYINAHSVRVLRWGKVLCQSFTKREYNGQAVIRTVPPLVPGSIKRCTCGSVATNNMGRNDFSLDRLHSMWD